ncbi:MAG: fibronectin type III domain-containing protein [Candidatus Scalinduaceae bacterium]
MNRTRLSYVLMFGMILLFTFYISLSGYCETRLDTDTPGGNYSRYPQTISDNSGHVYVVWRDGRNGKDDIYFNYSSDYGATWQANDIRLDTDTPGSNYSRFPEITSDNSGHVYVVWDDRRNGAYDVYFNHSNDYGATWQANDTRLDTGDTAPSTHSLYPQINCDDNGHVYAAWDDWRGTRWDIYLNYSSNHGATWSGDKRLDTGDSAGANDSFLPSISNDGSGYVYVAWEDYRNGSGSDIYFNYSSNFGVDWQASDKRLDTDAGNSDSWSTQLSSDGNGHVYATWEDYRNNGSGDIYFNYSSDYGATWQASDIKLDTGDSAGTSDSWYPEISSDGKGHVYVTWEDYRDVMSDIYFNYSSDDGATWQLNDIRLDVGDPPGANNSHYPHISSDGSGYVFATWFDKRSTSVFDIYFSYSSDYGATWQLNDTRLDTGPKTGNSVSFGPEISNDSSGHIYVTWDDSRNGAPDIYFDTLSSPKINANVIDIVDNWKYFKGFSNPGAGWSNISFDDSGWLAGPTGIGFGDGDDATVLTDMQYYYTTVYARKAFNVSDTAAVVSMRLRIDYDDGFVAYINGQEVIRANMPSGTPAFDTRASAQHEAGTPVVFDLSSYRSNLVTGNNVLAIEIHNSHINNNDLSMIPELEIESTTGGDPLQTNNVIATGDNWNYFKGSSNPGAGWDDVSFDDSAWLVGPTGIGYADGDDVTVLTDMLGNYSSVYARKTFNLSDVSAITDMTLRMDYDDGFVAYINGQEVIRANMPSGTPAYNTNASGAHEAGTPEEFDLALYTGNLVAGTNVLAIEIHNSDIGDDDLSMIPELYIVSQVGGGQSDISPPTTPANLTATAVLSSQINLSWGASTDDVGVIGYNIYRNSGGTPIARTTGTAYQDTGLSQGTLYTYNVSAVDLASNESTQSLPASATTFSPDTTPPSTPANLTATAVLSSQINLSWGVSTDDVGVTDYNIFRDGSGTPTATTTGTTYQDTGLSVGTLYTYNVSAVDLAGNESAQSSPASATTFAGDITPPSIPANLTATAVSSSQIGLSWEASTDKVGVTGYNIFRDGGGTPIATTTGITYQDTGLSAGTLYTYNVTAVDAALNQSAQSSPASDTTFTAADQSLIDYINTTTDSDKKIKDTLVAASPLSDAVLMALINKNPPLSSMNNQPVFDSNVPLSDTVWLALIPVDNIITSAAYRGHILLYTSQSISDTVWNAAINKGTIMLSAAWADALIYHSPLTEPVLNTLVNKEGIMSSLNYMNVLLENSPPITASNLPTSILTQLCAGNPASLDAADRQAVLDANSYTCP